MTGAASEHVPAFPGQRPPFEPGNELAKKHGAYAMQISESVEEKCAAIRTMCPAYSESDEYTIRLLAITLTRIERAQLALDRIDDASTANPLAPYLERGEEKGKVPVDRFDTLRGDLRSWINSAGRLLDALALTTTSRSRLGLRLVETRRVMNVVELHAVADAETIEAAE